MGVLLWFLVASGSFLGSCSGGEGNGRPCVGPIDDVHPSSADHLDIVEREGGLVLFATGYSGVQWNSLGEDGRLETASARLPDGLWLGWLDFFHAAVPWRNGFRVFTDQEAIYIDPGKTAGDLSPFTTTSPPIPGKFSIERVFVVGVVTYCVWSAIDPTEAQETWVAGLGEIGDDDRVTAVGDPFYRGPAPRGWAGLRFPGGYDPDEDSFWIDQPDQQHVLRVGRDGRVVQTASYASDVPYLLHWTKLPSGRWAGLHGGFWYLFSPFERLRQSAMTNVVPDKNVTTANTQYLDSKGRLWIAGPTPKEVVVRQWNDQSSSMGPEIRSPLSVGHCDSPVFTQ